MEIQRSFSDQIKIFNKILITVDVIAFIRAFLHASLTMYFNSFLKMFLFNYTPA